MQKEYRLKQNEKIQKLVHAKKRYNNELYTVYYQNNNTPTPLIAVTASKKYGNAVKRNYAKRVMREILRKKTEQLSGFQVLVIAKDAFATADFKTRERELTNLINKITKGKI